MQPEGFRKRGGLSRFRAAETGRGVARSRNEHRGESVEGGCKELQRPLRGLGEKHK